MGFYLRKSVSVGPFRFNFSQSGIGVSTGIKGLRIGTGPRGNYVQMGRNGIYFRQTFPPTHRRPTPQPVQEQPSSVQFEDIETVNVAQMVDSSSAALLEEIHSKAQKPLIWPRILACIIGLGFVEIVASAPAWLFVITVPLYIVGLILAVYADKLRKTVVLFYDLEPHIERAYESVHTTFGHLRSCSRVWHIDSQGRITSTYDWKVNAGASALVRRTDITPHIGSPPYFKCNVSIPVLPAKGRTLYFFPDRILVWSKTGVGAVAYDQLDATSADRRFIESGGVPSDSRVVDRTWKYVKKKGGPDRRFNDNREIPIVIYEETLLSSKSGLNELFQTSRTGIGMQIKCAVTAMVQALAERQEPQSDDSYIKCPCNNCDILIEFPAHGIGEHIACPHCGIETVLFRPEIQPD